MLEGFREWLNLQESPMMRSDSFGDDCVVMHEPEGGLMSFYYGNKQGMPHNMHFHPIWGMITIKRNDTCKFWTVDAVQTARGWGPYLYYVAMEFASHGGYNGLSPDQFSISDRAVGIWKNFHALKGQNGISYVPPPEEECTHMSFKRDRQMELDYLSGSFKKVPSELKKLRGANRLVAAPPSGSPLALMVIASEDEYKEFVREWEQAHQWQAYTPQKRVNI